MYKWKLDIILKSGKEMTVYYEGNENNSTDVANKVLTGNANDLIGFNNKDGTANVFVRLCDMSVISISVA